MGALVRGSHELAELARRTRPTVKDILESCAGLGVGGVQELKAEVIKAVPLDAAGAFADAEWRKQELMGWYSGL